MERHSALSLWRREYNRLNIPRCATNSNDRRSAHPLSNRSNEVARKSVIILVQKSRFEPKPDKVIRNIAGRRWTCSREIDGRDSVGC